MNLSANPNLRTRQRGRVHSATTASHRRQRRRGRVTMPRALIALVITAGVIAAAVLGSNGHATADVFTDKIAAKKHQLAADGAATAQITAATAELNSIQAALAAAQDNLAYTKAQLEIDRHQLQVDLVVIYKAQNASNSFSNFLN